MTVDQAREAARQWMVQEAGRIPGFWAAYTAGSTNWLPDNADLPAASDVDVMVVLADGEQVGARRKFIYRDTLIEVSYLRTGQLESPDRVLSDYHLAPSLRTAKVVFDPAGQLTPLLAAVTRDYAKLQWVRRRCGDAKEKILANLRSIDEHAAFHNQVNASLFTAGITTHVLLTAGLRNPTVRARYIAVRELLTDYGNLDFHEALLELLGVSRIGKQQAMRHVATMARIFDVAKNEIKTRFPFESDLSDDARPVAIDGSLQLIECGYHREAMFWIGVTHSRCQQVLACDAPPALTNGFQDAYRELAADMGLDTVADVRRRCREIEALLPRVCALAEEIIGRNREIENQ